MIIEALVYTGRNAIIMNLYSECEQIIVIAGCTKIRMSFDCDLCPSPGFTHRIIKKIFINLSYLVCLFRLLILPQQWGQENRFLLPSNSPLSTLPSLDDKWVHCFICTEHRCEIPLCEWHGVIHPGAACLLLLIIVFISPAKVNHFSALTLEYNQRP